VRAGDGEITALDILGQGIATGIRGIYIPQLLIKNRITKPLKEYHVRGRELEIAGVYELRDLGLSLENRQIILIDDVVTTGVTSRTIIGKILQRFPSAKINVFALGWTPSESQRRVLYEQHTAGLVLNEPQEHYGNYHRKPDDEDYQNGETYVQL
jgi:hypoxanthine phosphoribosyltransferase